MRPNMKVLKHKYNYLFKLQFIKDIMTYNGEYI